MTKYFEIICQYKNLNTPTKDKIVEHINNNPNDFNYIKYSKDIDSANDFFKSNKDLFESDEIYNLYLEFGEFIIKYYALKTLQEIN